MTHIHFLHRPCLMSNDSRLDLSSHSRKLNLEIWNNRYTWPDAGDEWKDQASFCGGSYETWKKNLIEAFIEPYCGPEGITLEIGPGHGRWTQALALRSARLHLVELSPNCLEACRKRFRDVGHLIFHLTPGTELPGIEDASVDFVWSYDVFVHIEPADIAAYLGEISRVLKPGGKCVIHHAAKSLSYLLARRLSRFVSPNLWSIVEKYFFPSQSGGWRSALCIRGFAGMARRSGLYVERQTDSWGTNGEFNCRCFRDMISVLTK